ncbi:NAD(P)/FAD-dependent oxidoreductase [soil metagenome]
MTQNENITIVGAGLVGCLLSLYMARRGCRVNMYDRRSDLRKNYLEYGRSINLALSDRGWQALDGIGIGDAIRQVGIPMYGRMMHNPQGKLSFQPYGKEGQAIYSVSRGGLNVAMLDLADAHPNVTIHFEQQCLGVDLPTNTLDFQDHAGGERVQVPAERILACDGAFSMVRNSMQKTDRYEYSQSYLEYGYKELSIAAAPDGGWVFEKHALHIWPRGQYMMIALPNRDGSFTCTLFLPFEGPSSFASLTSEEALQRFFGEVFPDALPLMPHLARDYLRNPTGSLVTIRCFPWAWQDKILLFGDASHAIVPFYGQGMNAGFEDCTVFDQLLEQHGFAWPTVFDLYQRPRKPTTDAMAALAVQHFIEMRDLVADPRFLLRKKIESRIHAQYPDEWTPLYSMVTFSHAPYAEALAAGKRHDEIMENVMPHV